MVGRASVVRLQVSLGAGAGIPVDAEHAGPDVAADLPVTLLAHVHHRLVQVAVHRPVLGSL